MDKFDQAHDRDNVSLVKLPKATVNLLMAYAVLNLITAPFSSKLELRNNEHVNAGLNYVPNGARRGPEPGEAEGEEVKLAKLQVKRCRWIGQESGSHLRAKRWWAGDIGGRKVGGVRGGD
ncbi:hypothetical protein NL676_011892 [Syzygium grande]|nr:hypothetical protein NL676_011892 [Syzygium grande]